MNHTIKKVKLLCIIMAAGMMALLSGCASGPHWKSEFTLPKPSKSLKGKSIVVSDFIRAEHGISVTGSARIREIRESAYVHDVSEIIASSLRSSGISAEAHVDARPSSLSAHEVLVRGAVIVERVERPKEVLNMVLFVSSLTIIGGILPSPLSSEVNPIVKYRAEIIDSNGRILMQSGEKEITAQFTCRWVWDCAPSGSPFDSANVKKKKAADEAVQKVSAVLADTLRR